MKYKTDIAGHCGPPAVFSAVLAVFLFFPGTARAVLSVSVDPGNLSLGMVVSPSTSVITSSITITNSGDEAATYTLTVSSSASEQMYPVSIWPDASGKFRMSAVFNGEGPTTKTDFDVLADYLAPAGFNRTATAGVFAGSETGVSVSAGGKRGLWLMFETSANNQVSGQQTITVTITAVAP